ncbi:MAG: hypothetical protein M3Y56_13670, partial [Armatimonadota bacterium]|nr:hypothetical protein [Armatimonadota bacterium]
VRKFTADSLVTTLAPLGGAKSVSPPEHNTGNGSFMAKWRLPNGGSLLGRDIVWETRVRYVTPPYFWFALWTAGNKWKWDGHSQGAEQDLVESFGYDNGGANTNYDGRFWHSNSVANPSKDTVDYGGWGTAMTKQGIPTYDATQYHIWTWVYKKDNTFAMYVDGKVVQKGVDYYWTYGNTAKDEPIDLVFLFDGGWGHNQIGSVNKKFDPAGFAGKYFEWNYSRVYLSGDGPLPAGQTRTTLTTDTGGPYRLSVQASSPAGARFHLEDETGHNLTGALTAPKSGKDPALVTMTGTTVLSAGIHTLTCVPEGSAVRPVRVTAALAATGATAKYIRTDRKTMGNWQGVYGADGYTVANAGPAKAPAYGTATVTTWAFTWTDGTAEARGLQKPGSKDRIAAQWGSNDPSYDIDCNLTDGKTHQVSLYGLDWDRGSRNEDIQVLDHDTKAVLDTLNFNTFVTGAYAVFNIRGHVTFHVVNRGGSNLALSGIFFDPIPAVGSPKDKTLKTAPVAPAPPSA